MPRIVSVRGIRSRDRDYAGRLLVCRSDTWMASLEPRRVSADIAQANQSSSHGSTYDPRPSHLGVRKVDGPRTYSCRLAGRACEEHPQLPPMVPMSG
jgi:hypothetical protein